MTVDGNPVRDNGPFVDAAQARAQFDAAATGMPAHATVTTLAAQMVIGEALLMTDVFPSGYESDELVRMAVELPVESIQVIAGWVIRAWLAGRESVASKDFHNASDL